MDPLATRLLPWLASVRQVTPTRLTLFSIAIRGLAVGAFATGNLVLGAVAYEVGFFVDCLDGKLARLTGRTSQVGAFVDVVGDACVTAGLFGALAWVAFSPGFAVFLVAAVFLESWLRVYLLSLVRAPGDRRPLTGLRRKLAARRLALLPSTVEVETAALFIAPLTTIGVVRGALVVTLAAYGLFVAAAARRVLRALRER